MNGFVGFLGAHGDFAVNLSVPVDRARQLRFEPNGGAPSCVPVPDRGFEPGIPPAPGRERLPTFRFRNYMLIHTWNSKPL
jgi:hypothetical protein